MIPITKSKPEVYPARPQRPWLLSDGTQIVDSCYDSHGTRLGRAYRAMNGLLRLVQDAWNPHLGRPEFCSLLIVFPDLTDTNIWMTDTVEAVQHRLDSYFDGLSELAGCGPLPRLEKAEVCAEHMGMVHAHVLMARPATRLYSLLGHAVIPENESGLRLFHLSAWVVLPETVLTTCAYFRKCRDARALRPWLDRRTLAEKEDGTRDAMASRQAALRQNAAQGRRRIKSATRFRHVPRSAQPLDDWTRAALVEIATGRVPCWTGLSFLTYLHRLARHLWRQTHESRRQAHRKARLARLTEGRAALRARTIKLRATRRESRLARRTAAKLRGKLAWPVVRRNWDVCMCSPVDGTHPSRGRHGLARARAPPGWSWPSILSRHPRSRPPVSRPAACITLSSEVLAQE